MVDESLEKLSQFLREKLRAHYKESPRPVFVSDAGQYLKKPDAPPAKLAEGTSLSAFIAANLGDEFELVQIGISEKRIVVVPRDSESRGRIVAQDPNFGFLTDQPRTLLAAFCVPVKPGQRVFYSLTHVRFAVVSESPPDRTYVEIPSNRRMPGRLVDQLAEWSALDRGALVENIRTWRSQASAQPQLERTAEVQPSLSTALHRLLEAQPQSIRSQLVIPGDIASILLRHR